MLNGDAFVLRQGIAFFEPITTPAIAATGWAKMKNEILSLLILSAQAHG